MLPTSVRFGSTDELHERRPTRLDDSQFGGEDAGSGQNNKHLESEVKKLKEEIVRLRADHAKGRDKYKAVKAEFKSQSLRIVDLDKQLAVSRVKIEMARQEDTRLQHHASNLEKWTTSRTKDDKAKIEAMTQEHIMSGLQQNYLHFTNQQLQKQLVESNETIKDLQDRLQDNITRQEREHTLNDYQTAALTEKMLSQQPKSQEFIVALSRDLADAEVREERALSSIEREKEKYRVLETKYQATVIDLINANSQQRKIQETLSRCEWRYDAYRRITRSMASKLVEILKNHMNCRDEFYHYLRHIPVTDSAAAIADFRNVTGVKAAAVGTANIIDPPAISTICSNGGRKRPIECSSESQISPDASGTTLNLRRSSRGKAAKLSR